MRRLRCALRLAILFIALGAVTIHSARAQDQAPPAPSGAPQLPDVNVVAEPPMQGGYGEGVGSGDIGLSGVFGSGPADGYLANSATTGTRIDVPIIDFPGTVDVVPQAVIEDQQILTVRDMLRDIPAAVPIGDSLRPDAFLLRGFEVRARDYRKNNFLDPSPAPRDFANVERVEVLTGPASLLYGGGQPAGVVNFITKKPLGYNYSDVEFQFGSFGLERYQVDVSGFANQSGNVLYRFNGAFEDQDSFRDFGFHERTFLSPVITWVIDDCTNLTWEGEYSYDRRHYDTGVVALNGVVGSVPISRSLNEPNDFQRFTDYKSSFFLNHVVNDDWSWRVGTTSTWYSAPSTGTVPIPSPFAAGSFLVRQRQVIDPFDEQYHSIIADLAGDVCIGGMEHKLLLGTEQGWFISNDFTAHTSIPAPDFIVPGGDLLLIDALNPVYGAPDPITPLEFDADFTQNRHGFYTQDLVKMNDYWYALGGVRYDVVHEKYERTQTINPFAPTYARNDDDFNAWTPKAGIVFQPIPDQVSFYATYSESFDPPGGGPRFDVNTLVPETGQLWEGGIKLEVAKSFSATFAGFHILKQNVIVIDQNTFSATQVGEVRNQGFEADATGYLTDRWSVIGNYAYVDSEVTQDAVPSRVGLPFRNVPNNSASLWTRYNFVQTDRATLGAAIGLVFVDKRSGDIDNTFTLPSYTRWDGGLYYQRGRLKASVYLENLFDKEYYTGSENDLAVFPGAPFNVRAALGWVY